MGKRKRPAKRPKLEIVFNEDSRKDFLTGFRKRKNERRQRAKVQLEEMVKIERKRIRDEVKDGVTKLRRSYAPLPFEDDIIQQELKAEENDDVTVSVIELTTKEIAEKRNMLGENRFSESEEEIDTDQKENVIPEELPGMALTAKKKENVNKKSVKKVTENKVDPKKMLKTKKDVDRMKKKTTLKSMKKSKVFQMKDRVNRLENKKLAKRQKNKDIRQLKSQGRRVEKKPDFRTLNKIRGKNPHKRKK